jgi:hypothetical protein
VRELGRPGPPEFYYANALLDKYTGTYERGRNEYVEVRRAPHGQLSLTLSGVTFLMSAESPTKFFAKTTDVQCEFQFTDADKVAVISVGEGGMRAKKIK